VDNVIDTIINKDGCPEHAAGKGIACWHIITAKGMVNFAVCGKRIRRAGYNGRIHPSSLRKK
jgi:hypothetical protein